MFRVPSREIADRIEAFRNLLAEEEIDAAIIRQNTDLYYFTGTVQDAHLIVPAKGRPVLLVRRDYGRAVEQSLFRPIVASKSLAEVPRALFDACETAPKNIGMELDVLPTNTFFTFDEKLFPKQEIVDVSPLIRRLRMVKSNWEVEMMRGAAACARTVSDAVPGILREGMTELELHAELEAVARKAGHIGIVRFRAFNMEMGFAHILSGPDAVIGSYTDSPTGGHGPSPAFGQGAGLRRIRAGEMVSVDIMVSNHGYLNDQTRNYCMGAPPRRLKDAYDVARTLHERFRESAGPGMITGDLYELVIDWVNEAGLSDVFMGEGGPRISFVAHGIGLEVDEFPFIARGQKLRLEAGMTMAFEPKFMIPDVGLAGLENTYLVVEGGLERLNTASEDLVVL